MGKTAKKALGYAFTWLTKGEADKFEEVRKAIEETVAEAVCKVMAASLHDTLIDSIIDVLAALVNRPDLLKKAIAALRAAGVRIPEAEEETGAAETAGTAGTAETPVAVEQPAADEPLMLWEYGGFDGSKAVAVDDAALAKATLKGNTLSFEWANGDCRDLGATSKTDADHTVACLFVMTSGGGVVGGKFEWVSTSRKTRSVKNIKEEGYNGWPKDALDDGGRLFFCVAGVKDDKLTSNGLRTALVEVVRA